MVGLWGDLYDCDCMAFGGELGREFSGEGVLLEREPPEVGREVARPAVTTCAKVFWE